MLHSQLPNEEDFKEWLSHPVTQLVLHAFMPACEQSLKDQWAAGNFTGNTLEVTMVANMQAVAQSQVYKELAELDFSKFSGVLLDE